MAVGSRRKSGTSHTKGPSELRRVQDALAERKRFKGKSWSELRSKLGLADCMTTRDLHSCVERLARQGAIKLQTPNGKICIYNSQHSPEV